MLYDPIEKEIVDALEKFVPVAINNRYSDADWTKAAKAIHGALGHKRGYRTYFKDGPGRPFSQIQRDIGQMLGGVQVPGVINEWLYDILWWEQDQNGYVTDISLVVESEWGSVKDVKDDFQRLLLSRSKYRVMIFQCGRNIIEWCKNQVKKFKYTQTGDRYLFCSWEAKNNQSFYFELYVVP